MSLKLEIGNKVDYIREETSNDNQLLWINEGFENRDFRRFIEEIEIQKDGEKIYDVRNALIHFQADDIPGINEDIIIKKFNLTRRYDKLRFCFLDSKAVRSLKLALALEEVGLRTPKPIALLERRGRFNKIIYSYFITEYIDYDYNLLDILKDDNHPLRNKVKDWLPQIAKDIKGMHDAGIVHNDLHAGNILVKDIDKSPKFYYIDLNRGRIKNNLDIKSRMKDLARFKLTEDEQRIFMKYYAPQEYQRILSLMIKHRDKRKKFLYWKRQIKQLFKK
ncbi:lipopolysaccharide kinase (Kdo/WaaP) family protein [Orenia metallireducens]|uniref:Lipopolysaccharide kinase (Kdo/WaaP) family protein n=1 Tax=Orenia metallireducens TaxID=1413210 RepID=A0A285GM02_9FIRM|nr:lipopolysaccharide kinase InaA family protein [Orenia metallireducens]PRX35695.1 lipopolysaccharide kinase (Kdo/WaaP) family protein [Orenia metallireducens]SNY24475.1 Lipopolysaccharide kinase (Kdo/WaaP) family protein [Orenia metallireducens]